MNRRLIATACVGTLVLLAGCAPPPVASAEKADPPVTSTPPAIAEFTDAVADLETEFNARVGVSVLDSVGNDLLSYQADERFGFASTLKLFAVAVLLEQTTAKELQQRMTWSAQDLEASGYSPVTEEHIDDGMTLGELAEAALRESDNTATNIIIDYLGGTKGLDAALETWGDDITDVVDNEPGLNTVSDESTANTTSPAAFARTLQLIAAEGLLEESDLRLLTTWLSGNATGDPLIRAGAPDGWTIMDKSGGARGIRNDIAIAYPAEGDPIVIVIMTTRLDEEAEYDDALIADIASEVFSALP